MPNPNEFNLLTNVQYKLEIPTLPNLTYWVQTAFLPTVSIEGGLLSSPNREIPVPGHKLEFDSMTMTFLLDQDLRNYEEIYYWMLKIQVEKQFSEMTQDIKLHFLTGQMNISRTITLVGAYPTTLTEVAMGSDDSDSVGVIGSVIFQYQYFTFNNGNFPYEIE